MYAHFHGYVNMYIDTQIRWTAIEKDTWHWPPHRHTHVLRHLHMCIHIWTHKYIDTNKQEDQCSVPQNLCNIYPVVICNCNSTMPLVGSQPSFFCEFKANERCFKVQQGWRTFKFILWALHAWTHMCTYIHTFTYTYTEREREVEINCQIKMPNSSLILADVLR